MLSRERSVGERTITSDVEYIPELRPELIVGKPGTPEIA